MEPISSLSFKNPIEKIYSLNYVVDNKSDVSEIFKTDTTRATRGINGTSPVQYPTAEVTNANGISQIEKNKEFNKKMNSVATAFEGISTGYNKSKVGTTYEILGRNIDEFI